MARVFYTTFDGEDRTVRLTEHQPVRIGREAVNDVVLRDPKASRMHAQIVFERGFYVIHDLDSANGTWIEGKRVRVAPLRDGADIRIGNTHLRFSEELPVDEGDGPTTAAPLRGGAPLDSAPEDPPPIAEDYPPLPPLPPSVPVEPSTHYSPGQAISRPTHDNAPTARALVTEEPTRAIPASQLPVISPAATRPIEIGASPIEPDRKTTQRQSLPPLSQAPATRSQMPDTAPDELRTERHGAGQGRSEPPPSSEMLRRLANQKLLIDDFETGLGESAVRNEIDQPLIWFRAPRSATALVAGFVATMIIIAGIAVLAFLVYERAWPAAAAAFLITIAFASMVGAAIPRRYVPVWQSMPPGQPALTIAQEPGLPLPQLRFAILADQGTILGITAKQVFPSMGRRVWQLLDSSGSQELARATEDSLIRSLIGRIIGGSIRVLRTNYTISSGHKTLGSLERARGRPGRLLLDLSGDDRAIDRRLVLALALTIVAVER